MKHITTFLLLAGLSCFTALAADETKPAEKPAESAKPTGPRVCLKTNKGNIVIELNKAKAPVSVANFLTYVEKKHYDRTVFHRVMSDFMIQGGGFAMEGAKLVEKATDAGIKNESQNGLKNVRGSVAMARTPAPDSATAQFFINVVDNASLDFPSFDGHGYAVFGKVVEGMDVVDKIKAVQTHSTALVMTNPDTGAKVNAPSENVPVEPVTIESAAVVK
jgi:cyclophilin family peptidyl-prolyl cis-trans isomerase